MNPLWTPRVVVLLLLFLIPVLVFLAAGAYYIWQQPWGWLVSWSMLLCSATAVLLAWHWQKRGRLIPPLDTTPPLQWSDTDRRAWELVVAESKQTEQIPPEQYLNAEFYFQRGQDVALKVARVYHPTAQDPYGRLTALELLAVAELASSDLYRLIAKYVPGSHLLTIDQWKMTKTAVAWFKTASNLWWAVSALINPLQTGLRYAASQAGVVTPTRRLQENLMEWFYTAFIQRLGYYLIEVHSGRLKVGSARYKELLRAHGLSESSLLSATPDSLPGASVTPESPTPASPTTPMAAATSATPGAPTSASTLGGAASAVSSATSASSPSLTSPTSTTTTATTATTASSSSTSSAAPAAPASTWNAIRPVTLAVLGQVKAGKSTVINGLLGEVRAETSVLPWTQGVQRYEVSLPGVPRALVLLDTEGYDGSGANATQREAAQEASRNADLIFLVTHARNPARQADVDLLDDLRQWFRDRPDLRFPPVVVLLTHIDGLSPMREWSPPYDWRSGSRPKEQSIRQAVEAARESFGDRVVEVLPVCWADSSNEGRDDVLRAIATRLSEAQVNGFLRALHQEVNAERFSKLGQQALQAGQAVWEVGKALLTDFLSGKKRR